jgi:DNA-binding SARP family transcriptional activator
VTPGLPDGLTVTPSLAAALDLLETEITRRLRLHEAGHDGPVPGPRAAAGTAAAPLALIATVDPPSAPRVQAVLEAGAGAGITAILLGRWPAGTTCHIGTGGIVTAASDPALAGAQACHLPAADTMAMLSLLRGAQGHLAPDQPAPAAPPARRPQATAQPRPPRPPRAPQQPASRDLGARGGQDRAPGHSTSPRPAAPHPRHDQAGAAARSPIPPATPPAGGPPAGRSAAALSPASAAATPVPAATPGTGRPVTISVLGPLRISASGGGEITGGLRKARELLAYLAVHPDGVTGEAISAALWPESAPRYAVSQRKLALRRAREMLRTATGQPAALFIVLAGDRYRLDPALIAADLWQFDTALDRARHATSGQDQLTALQQAAGLYHGPLADGAGYDWAEQHAEPARRRAVDALARIAATLAPRDPEQALTVLDTALAHDPYNEALYQQIMRIQARLGRPDAARRTLALLEARLARLGLSPAPATGQAAAPAPGS